MGVGLGFGFGNLGNLNFPALAAALSALSLLNFASKAASPAAPAADVVGSGNKIPNIDNPINAISIASNALLINPCKSSESISFSSGGSCGFPSSSVSLPATLAFVPKASPPALLASSGCRSAGIPPDKLNGTFSVKSPLLYRSNIQSACSIVKFELNDVN